MHFQTNAHQVQGWCRQVQWHQDTAAMDGCVMVCENACILMREYFMKSKLKTGSHLDAVDDDCASVCEDSTMHVPH